MAVPAASQPRTATDRRAILEAAYPHAQRIAFARWLARIDRSEIDGLVNNAVIALLNGEADIIDVPRTTKYLTTFIDWRAKDYLRTQKRRPHETALPDDEAAAPGELQHALTAAGQTPEEAIESTHVRDLVDEIKKRIPSRVNRLIVHLFYYDHRSCPEIAQTVKRVLGVELTVKAVARRKEEAINTLTIEWGRAFSGEHCRELATATQGAEKAALTSYALDLLDLDNPDEAHLHEIVAAHLKHCAHCRADAADARRDMRQVALLAVPILVGSSDNGLHTAEHTMAHAPGVFDRAMDAVRSGVGRGTLRAAEAAPNGGASAGEMVGSASAGGGVAIGGGLAAKLLVAGTAAVCAMGGQQICAQLLNTPSGPGHEHRSAHHHRHHRTSTKTASLAPSAPVPPPARSAPAAGQLGHVGASTIQRARQQASSSSTSGSTGGSTDPTFDPTAPTQSSGRSSSSSSSGTGGSSGGDSTFNNLP